MIRLDPRIRQLEAVCGPAEDWAGRCNELALAMVELGLARGQVVFGIWRGPIAAGIPRTQLMGGALHSWIQREDGGVVDPTRWVFEGGLPYVYEGPRDHYRFSNEPIEDAERQSEHPKGAMIVWSRRRGRASYHAFDCDGPGLRSDRAACGEPWASGDQMTWTAEEDPGDLCACCAALMGVPDPSPGSSGAPREGD